jgi:hypothetical protein
VTVVEATAPVVSKMAVAVAPKPPPPASVTVGAEVYPVPPSVTKIAVTWPPVRVAVPIAPVPPPPENWTVGTLV